MIHHALHAKMQYFLAVGETLSFRTAAEQIGIAQPALSRSIRQLEQQLGFALFERTTRRVTLTPAMQALTLKPERADLMRSAQQSLQSIIRLRWILIDGADGTLYTPLFIILVAWLVLIFASVGFNAPNNPVVIVTVVTAARTLTRST